MEHTHRPIIVCGHIMERADKNPDVLWVEAGEIQAAVCFACADQTNSANDLDEDPPEAMHPLCAECARLERVPTAVKMPDGFYEWHDGQWLRQADTNEVN
jgi:hypothetical protein